MVIYHSIKAKGREKKPIFELLKLQTIHPATFFLHVLRNSVLIDNGMTNQKRGTRYFFMKNVRIMHNFCHNLPILCGLSITFFFQNQLWLYTTSNAKGITLVTIYSYGKL